MCVGCVRVDPFVSSVYAVVFVDECVHVFYLYMLVLKKLGPVIFCWSYGQGTGTQAPPLGDPRSTIVVEGGY